MRPFLPWEEEAADEGSAWVFESDTVLSDVRGRRYGFERVFTPGDTTATVYSAVAGPILESVLMGFNGTLFAYGQTASGKTHTMMGSAEDPGILPRAVREVFAHISRTRDQIFLLRVSYLEIYNEEVNDLLELGARDLAIREVDGAFVVPDAKEVIVKSEADVMDLVSQGEANRAVGKSNLNEHSSRSHTIFRMIIEATSAEGGGGDERGPGGGSRPVSRSRGTSSRSKTKTLGGDAVNISELNLVDLAGSETLTERFGSRQQKETKSINLSLTQLKSVIQALSKGESYVPFRNSSLTKILRTSLGGNAKTAVICTGSPAEEHYKQTKMTLLFGSMAKRIVNSAIINQTYDDDKAMIKQYRAQIAALSKKLAAFDSVQAQKQRLQAAYAQLEAEVLALREGEAERASLSDQIGSMGVVSSSTLARAPGASRGVDGISDAQLRSLMGQLSGLREQNTQLASSLAAEKKSNAAKTRALSDAHSQLKALMASGPGGDEDLLAWLAGLIESYEARIETLEASNSELLSLKVAVEMDAADKIAVLKRQVKRLQSELSASRATLESSLISRRQPHHEGSSSSRGGSVGGGGGEGYTFFLPPASDGFDADESSSSING